MDAIYSVPQNNHGQELLDRGTPLFPCAIYDRDIREYITGEIPPHWHHEIEIFLLIDGSAHISLADTEFDLQSGDGCLINADVLHGVSCPFDSGCHYHSIVFDPCIIFGAPGSAYDLLYVRPFMNQGGPAWLFQSGGQTCGQVITALFHTAFHACENEADGYEFIVRDALSRIFLLLKENLQGTPGKQSSYQEHRMKQMLSWLDEHYMEQVSISQLADAAGICVRECQRSFSDMLHTTPMKYLARRRVTMAAELLVSTDLAVSEIGLSCGFDNPSYFAKQFKHITGLTPRSYRQKYHTRYEEFQQA